MSKDRGAYMSWYLARTRCHDRTAASYRDYGGRGIRMCARWRRSYACFLADMGPRPNGLQLDRIDNDGPYAPGNCRWATRIEQAGNKRNSRLITFRGETFCVSEWERRRGFPRKTVLGRLRLGWSVARALMEPLRQSVDGHYMKAWR